MEKKHYICTHTWSNPDTIKDVIKQQGEMTDKEFFAGLKTEKAETLQHWMGNSEFFFCHWFADSEEAIHSAIELSGTHELIVTLASQVPMVVSSFDLKDTKLVERSGH